jgi:hypothetical protein
MPQTMLRRLCDAGRIPSIDAGSTRRIVAATVHKILQERERIKTESRHAIETAEERRRLRAATAAGVVPQTRCFLDRSEISEVLR